MPKGSNNFNKGTSVPNRVFILSKKKSEYLKYPSNEMLNTKPTIKNTFRVLIDFCIICWPINAFVNNETPISNRYFTSKYA